MIPLRLKIEINTREHFSVFGVEPRLFGIQSPWFEGKAEIQSFTLDELMGTKLRALYQRRKGRDLFDLWIALGMDEVDPERIVQAFRRYMEAEGNTVTRSEFEKNLAAKVGLRSFGEDLRLLLAPGVEYNVAEAAARIEAELLELL